jgi:lipopolysaccharide cholinephosphotransferase
MLPFSKEFFLGETRDGFYVEPMMKCAWAAQLEVLAVIEGICNKYGLQYFADWGTLLGAVRHHGFIPWDDDMDICMLRKDYDKFFAVAAQELPEEYRILDVNNRLEWNQLFARIINAESVCYNDDRLMKFHGCPFVVGIDIFPLDDLPEDPQEEELFLKFFTSVYFPGYLYAQDPSEIDEMLPDLETLCNRKFDRSKSIQNQLLKTADLIERTYQNSDSPFISNLANHVSEKKQYLRKEWYQDCIYLPFEEFELPVPVGYDGVLTTLYGDYMTPVRNTSTHNYPFYKVQQEVYKQTVMERLLGSSYNPDNGQK